MSLLAIRRLPSCRICVGSARLALQYQYFLSTSVKGVVSRPDIYVQFWLSGAHGHYNFPVAVNLSFWIPLG
jgi:hypothetical protein